MTGLTDVADRRVGTFSLGMKQRLATAAALLGDPSTLILDEPSNGLDPQGIRWLRDLLSALARDGRTVLVSSHLIGELALTAEWVVLIARGRLVTDSPIRDLVTEGGPALEQVYLDLTRDLTDFTTRTHHEGPR